MNRLWCHIEKNLPQLWRTVRAYEANQALQDELMQEVLLAIWQALPRLRDETKLTGFALRIAHNLCAAHVRSAVRMPSTVTLDDAIHAQAIGNPAEHDGAWLLAAIRCVPIPLRQVLLLQLEGFEYREIADLLDISVDNVGVRAHRARKLLKEIHDADR